MESTTRTPFWNRRTYCLITGASQGIGRQISIQFARAVAEGSTFLLLARNLTNLTETKAQMLAANPRVNVFVRSVDFYEVGQASDYEATIRESMATFGTDVSDFDLAMIVHNAGSLGDLTELTRDVTDPEKLTRYFTLNLFSVCSLNGAFVKTFDPESGRRCQICVVNITSLCAVQPFASMAYYCVGKASRQMFFAVLAEENKEYLVLNYSPGPVLTDMTDDIVTNIRNDEVRDMFVKMKQDSTILSAEESVAKLVKVLDLRQFKSGDRVDYYDA